MNDKQLKQTLLRQLAEESIPENYDPWQKLLTRIKHEAAINGAMQQKHTTKSVHSRIFKPMAAIITLLFMAFGIFLFVSPQGQALAQGILRFFKPIQTSEESVPMVSTPLPLIEITPFVQASNATQKNPNLEDAQKKVNYSLMQLSFLPQGYHFESAQVDGECVTLSYKNDAESISLWLEQLPLHGAEQEPISVGSAASIEPAQVGNDYAEYIQGSYFGDQSNWNADSGTSFLRWQHDDMLYTISAVVNLTSGTSEATLSKESLLAMAENLTDDLSAKQSVDPNHINNLEDTEKLAGFKILAPAALPAGYQFDFATIEDGTGFVCLQYAYNGASYPSLFIRQSATSPLTELRPNANNPLDISTVKIAGSEGEPKYAIGFNSPEKACDLQKDIFRAGQALLWETGGISFELYTEFRLPEGGAGLSQTQMIALAESIMGSSSSDQTVLDTNSYRDLDEAERAAGYNIQIPTKLPLGSTLNSIHLLRDSSMVLFTNPQFGSPNIRLYQCPTENVADSPCHSLMENIPEDFKASLTMGNITAVYTKGDFGMVANESDTFWHEIDPSGTQRIYWQNGNWDYLLVSTGNGINQQLLVEIANTMP
ncbi:MAG: hypothetical protein AB9907_00320 [Flexilinea sp.]